MAKQPLQKPTFKLWVILRVINLCGMWLNSMYLILLWCPCILTQLLHGNGLARNGLHTSRQLSHFSKTSSWLTTATVLVFARARDDSFTDFLWPCTGKKTTKIFRSGVDSAITLFSSVFQEHTLEVTITCWWWPSTFAWKESASQRVKTHVWPPKAERSQCVGNLPSYDRRKVWTSHHNEQWRHRHGFSDHLQYSSDRNSQWDRWQTSSEQNKTKTGSLQKFFICATKGENWGRKHANLKDMRNTRKWTTTSRGAWKRQKKTG